MIDVTILIIVAIWVGIFASGGILKLSAGIIIALIFASVLILLIVAYCEAIRLSKLEESESSEH